MNKVKFYLMQVTLVVIVSLILGSPVLAKGKGVQNGNASESGVANASTTAGGDGGENRGHAGSHSSGGGNGGKPNDDGSGTGDDTGTNEPVCLSGDTSGCTAETCGPAGGFWGDDSVCYFFG
jgi:hypothetical protein